MKRLWDCEDGPILQLAIKFCYTGMISGTESSGISYTSGNGVSICPVVELSTGVVLRVVASSVADLDGFLGDLDLHVVRIPHCGCQECF